MNRTESNLEIIMRVIDTEAGAALDRIGRPLDIPRKVGETDRAFLTDAEFTALTSAYCALVQASCVAQDVREASRALDDCIRIAERLGLPADVLPQRGEQQAAILVRFAAWLERRAKQREAFG